MAEARACARGSLLRALLVCAAIVATQACADSTSDKLEKALGEAIRWLVETTAPLDTDPLLVGMVDRMGADLASAGGRSTVTFHYRILDVEDVNAMAVPGGWIWVTKGALRFVESPDELAGILGHETGHVTCRHGWKSFERDMLYNAVLLGTPLGSAGSLLQWVDGAYTVGGLKLSRDDENEADSCGAEFSLMAGYDPLRMPDFFGRMLAERDGKHLSRLDVFFSTHPADEERLRRLAANPALSPESDALLRRADGYLSRCRFAQALVAYEEACKAGGDPERAHLGAATSAAFLGDTSRAGSHLDAARAFAGPVAGDSEPAARAERIAAQLGSAPRAVALSPPTVAEVEAATAAIDRAKVAAESSLPNVKTRSNALAAERTEVRSALAALANAAQAAARAVGGQGAGLRASALPGTCGVLTRARSAAVASDARSKGLQRALEERARLLDELRGVVTGGDSRAARAGVELARRLPTDPGDVDRQVADVLRLTERSLTTLENACEELARSPESLAVPEGQRPFRGTSGVLLGAEQLSAEAAESLATLDLDNAALSLGIEGAVSPLDPAVFDAAIASLLGASEDEAAAARRAAEDVGGQVLILAVSREKGVPVSVAAQGLAKSGPIADRVRGLGGDPDAVAIACHLIARAFEAERAARAHLNAAQPS
jgi:Zn-dependent protease with chaperone function